MPEGLWRPLPKGQRTKDLGLVCMGEGGLLAQVILLCSYGFVPYAITVDLLRKHFTGLLCFQQCCVFLMRWLSGKGLFLSLLFCPSELYAAQGLHGEGGWPGRGGAGELQGVSPLRWTQVHLEIGDY